MFIIFDQGAVCWPMLLSTFSHYSFLHLAANMYVLHSFSSLAVAALGKEQFVALYLTSGVVSSFASHLYKTAFGFQSPSLGAVCICLTHVYCICTNSTVFPVITFYLLCSQEQ